MPSRSTRLASLGLGLGLACASPPSRSQAPLPRPAAVAVADEGAAPLCRRTFSAGARAQGLAAARAGLSTGDRASALALARCLHLAADVEPDEARVMTLTEEAMAGLARAGLDATDAEAAYLHALNLGLFVRAKGMLALGRLNELVALLKVAGTAPAQEQGGPLRVLGLLYLKAPGWPVGPGDLEAALELLRRAAQDYPQHPLNHLYLAYALLEAGERSQSVAALERARSLCAAESFGEWAARWRDEVDALRARAR